MLLEDVLLGIKAASEVAEQLAKPGVLAQASPAQQAQLVAARNGTRQMHGALVAVSLMQAYADGTGKVWVQKSEPPT